MPPASTILEQLTTTTTELTFVAISWHFAILAIALALLARWRPSAPQTALLLISPALSVAIISAAYSSWFNAISFGLLALVLVVALDDIDLRWRLQGPGWSRWLGLALVAYGFCYPHFVAGGWYRAVFAAPVGLVPCPTLAVLVGFTLMGRAGGSRAIPALLAVWTTFYALFGIFVLGVVLDVGLFVAAVGISALAVQNYRTGASARPTASSRPAAA